jgi:ribose-phosphate pyrophosphokinase
MTSHSNPHQMKVYGEIKLFGGSGSPELSRKISEYLESPLCERELVEFPNENLFIRLKHSVRGQDVYVIQQTATPVHRNLMELLITLQTLRLDSAARITAVTPYLCYGRSDKKDQPRVPITGRLVADMIEVAGADRYMTLDPHAGQIQGFFSIPGDVLTASRLIIDEIRTTLVPTLRDPVVVATDLGFAKKARNYAADLEMPVAFIEKRRAGNESRAEALSLIGDVAGSDVLIVDDEVDTGGSIMQAIKVVKENGALDVYLAFVHAVLSADAAQQLAALPIKRLITTDSVPMSSEKLSVLGERLTVLSVSSLLGEVILRAHEGRSVGEMFNE